MILQIIQTFYDIKNKKIQNKGFYMQEGEVNRIIELEKRYVAKALYENEVLELLNSYHIKLSKF